MPPTVLPILSIVGRKKSGKTTFLERLIPLLVERGYRVGTLKHDGHGFEIDHPGKDTYRHRQAGALEVVIASSRQLALVKTLDRELGVREIVQRYFRDTELILTEGYKQEAWPKIEVSQGTCPEDLLFGNGTGLIAVVAQERFLMAVPCFTWEEIPQVADLIEAQLPGSLRGKGAL